MLKCVILKHTVRTKCFRKEVYLDPFLNNPQEKCISETADSTLRKQIITLPINVCEWLFVTAMPSVIAGKCQALASSKPLFPYSIELEWFLTRIKILLIWMPMRFSILQYWNNFVSCIIYAQYAILYGLVIDKENHCFRYCTWWWLRMLFGYVCNLQSVWKVTIQALS